MEPTIFNTLKMWVAASFPPSLRHRSAILFIAELINESRHRPPCAGWRISCFPPPGISRLADHQNMSSSCCRRTTLLWPRRSTCWLSGSSRWVRVRTQDWFLFATCFFDSLKPTLLVNCIGIFISISYSSLATLRTRMSTQTRSGAEM